MNLNFRWCFYFAIALLFTACKYDRNEETILKGNATIVVDETILPVIQDQVEIFENKYDAKITLVAKSEAEVLNDLYNGKAGIVILTRNLTEKEKINFSQKKIIPKITNFATDAIALINNKASNDTLLTVTDVVKFLKQEPGTKCKGLVFDNPNSSTVSYLKSLANLTTLPEKNVYSFKSNEEVIKFVADNDGIIGVIGMNWLTQPSPKMQKYMDQINILSIKNEKTNTYVNPSQNDLAENTYPLARDLFIVNCQGYTGLGMGFASFIAGDIGQRIVLKSGLYPVRTPGRKFNIRNAIDSENEKE